MQGLCRGWEVLIGALSPPRPALPRLNSEQSELCNAGARAGPGARRTYGRRYFLRRQEGEDKKAAHFLLYRLDASYLDVPNLTRRSHSRALRRRPSSTALINLVKKTK